MADFSKDILSFYKYITPVDALGKFKLDNQLGAKTQNQNKPKSTLTSLETQQLMDVFVENAVSGLHTIVNQKSKTGALPSEIIAMSEKGMWNGLHQEWKNTKTTYFFNGYWKCQHSNKQKVVNPKTQKEETKSESIYKVPANFLGQVCRGSVDETGVGPPVDFSMILMRAPMLSVTRRNTELIQLYLTAMPPIFANRLMPYCDVEFQIPFLQTKAGLGAAELGIVNRPSLYRFLVGSGADVNNLTEADRSLTYVNQPSSTTISAARRAKEDEAQAILDKGRVSFFGMEMFTTPQTLVNMDTMGANTDPAKARSTDVKPFLPPATITGVTVNIQNAGAGTFGYRSGGLTMKIHDKARLTEFAEFFRGNHGYSEATVWITYGMLAPRGGEDDAYAKLINENMLVREAFMISNVQFSFNIDGSIDVTLALAVKTSGALSLATISSGPSVKTIKKNLSTAIGYIKENAEKYGEPRTEKEGFGQAEIRIAQYINQVADGVLDPGTDKEKLAKEFKEIKALIAELEAPINKQPPAAGRATPQSEAEAKASKEKVKNETLASIQKRRPGFDLDTVKAMISKLEEIYGVPSAGNPKEKKKSLREKFKDTAVQYAEGKLKSAALVSEPDPFFPDNRKNAIDGPGDLGPLRKAEPPIVNFTDDLVSTCKISKDATTRQFVSFGKVFSLFCVDSILNSVANEFGWSKDAGASSCPYEVQIIFYQLNKNCGPVSGHNIAEFPVDITLFAEAFGNLVESYGGDDVSLIEFIDFLNSQMSDPRQPGYGRREYYKPIPPESQTDKEKENRFDLVPSSDSKTTFEGNMAKWTEKYGSSFVTPLLTVKTEVLQEASTDKNGTVTTDLLYDLAGRVGTGYTTPQFKTDPTKKTIVKFHIYDRTHSPFEDITKILRTTKSGKSVLFDTEDNANAFALKEKENAAKDGSALQTPTGYEIKGDKIYLNGEVVGVTIGQGKEALKEYLGAVVPRIEVGTNGSLISGLTLTSKTSGLEGTIAMQGGTQKRELTFGSTGLSQEQFNQPMVVYPAQLQMTTMGCPLAEVQQNFFVDFGTNTTIDNNYVVQKVSHTIGPAKFETQWELGYYDGYGRMINAGKIIDLLQETKEALAPSAASQPVQTPSQPAPQAGGSPNGPISPSAAPGRVGK